VFKKYPNTYKVIYNIIKEFSKYYRKKPLRIEVLKLTYLIDVEYYKKFGEKYSELDYVYYNYGPWDRAFHQIIAYMAEVEISEFKMQTQDEKDFYLYTTTGKTPRNDIRLNPEISEILEKIFFVYKHSQLGQMLKIVYTEEPMASTKQGECIDMSKLKLNSREKRDQYRKKRKKYLGKISKIEHNIEEDDLEIYQAFKLLRDRANSTL